MCYTKVVMNKNLLTPGELDERLSYPSGRSARLARRGLIPHVVLPDSEIRFDPDAINEWLRENSAPEATHEPE